MKWPKNSLLLIALFLQLTTCFAQDSLLLFETKAHLKTLSSDEMEGRKAGTEGYLKAVTYIKAVLKSQQIQPFFNGSYTDSVYVGNQYAPNVIGIIPGSSDEFIVLGAHLDHIGTEANRIFNGANDNATGVVTLIQIAKHLKQQLTNQKKTIIIVFFTAEELGLWGSKFFAEHLHRNQLAPEYMLNFEMLGQPISRKKKRKVYLLGKRYTNLDEELEKLYSEPFIETLRKDWMSNVFKRSDNYSFHNTFPDCPSLTFITFNGNTNYRHYHKHTDTYKQLDVEHLHELIKKLAMGIEYLLKEDITVIKES